MSASRANPIVRLFPSLTDVTFLMPLVFLFARMDGAKTMLGDGDTGWHVRTGEWILSNHAVPRQDVFSYTKPGAPWFAWEWLWDAVFAWLHLHWGMAAVVFTSILVLCFTSALLFRLVARTSGNRLVAAALTLVAVAGSSMHWLARPHLFTMLFVVIWASMLERIEEGRVRLLCWMPPLTILWTNLHGGFFVGAVILGAYAAGKLAVWLLETDGGKRLEALVSARHYAVTAAACLAASLVNPYGYHLHAHILRYFTDSYHFDNISEFQSLSFHSPSAGMFEIMLGLGFVAAAWFLKQRQFHRVFLLAGWAHLALIAGRNIPLFLLLAAPIVGKCWSEMRETYAEMALAPWASCALASFEQIAAEVAGIDRLWRTHVISAGAAVVLGLAFAYPGGSTKLKAEYDPQRYPAKAVEALQARSDVQRIFTDDEWGDYLIYRLYPRHKVYVDGRSDFYGGDFGRDYLDIVNVKYKWQAYLDRYGVDTILLQAASPLAGAVKESKRWRVVYDDGVAIVFTPPAVAEQEFSTSRGKECGAGRSGTVSAGITKSNKERTIL